MKRLISAGILLLFTLCILVDIHTHLDENSKINSANAIVSILPH